MRFYPLFSVHIHAFLFPFARPSFASHLRALLLAFDRPISPCPRISIVAGKDSISSYFLRLLGQSIFSNRDGGVSEIRKVSRRLIVELEIG